MVKTQFQPSLLSFFLIYWISYFNCSAFFRRFYYLQLKSQILEGSLSCGKDTAVLLASYSAQGEGYFSDPWWLSSSTCIYMHVHQSHVPQLQPTLYPYSFTPKNPNFFPLFKNMFIKLIINRSAQRKIVYYISHLKHQLCLAELGDYEAEKFSSYIEDQSLFPWVSFQLQ